MEMAIGECILVKAKTGSTHPQDPFRSSSSEQVNPRFVSTLEFCQLDGGAIASSKDNFDVLSYQIWDGHNRLNY